jgi:hypothetical protein
MSKVYEHIDIQQDDREYTRHYCVDHESTNEEEYL